MRKFAVKRDILRTLCGAWLLSILAFPCAVFAGGLKECVGRYELALPGVVDVATTTPHLLEKTVREKYISRPIRFPDEEPAALSSFGSDGEFEIVRGVSYSGFEQFNFDFKNGIKYTSEDDDRYMNEMPTNRPWVVAYFSKIYAGFNLYENKQIIVFSVSGNPYGHDAATVKKSMMETIAKLRFRQDYEIPHGEGVCLPGIFIVDGKRSREVGVTFRLKEHPDVTIFFKDKTSSQMPRMVDVHNMPIGRETNLTSREQNEFVWTYSGLGKEVKLAHDPFPFHTVELDGRKGVASFGTITRGDGTTDYGYLVTVQGDPKAAVDTPDLTLLVERTAKNAKGKPPVSPDELKQIAKFIAASVKRLPIQ